MRIQKHLVLQAWTSCRAISLRHADDMLDGWMGGRTDGRMDGWSSLRHGFRVQHAAPLSWGEPRQHENTMTGRGKGKTA